MQACEPRANLKDFVERAKTGERIVVTDRGAPVRSGSDSRVPGPAESAIWTTARTTRTRGRKARDERALRCER
jgi:antitoxin (DNA-binding transcriptional repressor) of toxin-antitoxin stability system